MYKKEFVNHTSHQSIRNKNFNESKKKNNEKNDLHQIVSYVQIHNQLAAF